MSHFSVMVISNSPNGEIDRLLAPFIEQVEKGSEYAEFKSTEEEDKKEYETGGISAFHGRDMDDIGEEKYKELKQNKVVKIENLIGMFYSQDREPAEQAIGRFTYWRRGEGWHKRLFAVITEVQKKEEEKEGRKITSFSFKAYLIPPPKKVPFKNVYKTFEEFEKEWNGNEERDDIGGSYGYWHNPMAKWDWYQIGGRWAGHLMAKLTKTGNRGEPSWAMGEGYQYKIREYDQLQYKDIDTEAMMARDRKQFAEYYDKEYEDAEKACVEYYDTGKADKKDFPTREDYFWSRIDGFSGIKRGTTKEDYVKSRMEEHPLHTHAIITKDGEWLEKGRMGWWGIVFDENKQKYEKDFDKVLNEINPTDWITIVDCHI